MADRFLVGSFSEPGAMLGSVATLRRAGVAIHDVFAPYPVHGLDQAMGIRRSRLPLVTLIAGLGGLCFALAFQYYTAVFDWPLDVGGKPENSTLAFVPVCFELTVLIGGLSTVGAFLLRARLFPGKREELPVLGVTNNVFAIVTPVSLDGNEGELARRIMIEHGADEVEEREGES
jgi:Alternative complex III, ActD subunit